MSQARSETDQKGLNGARGRELTQASTLIRPLPQPARGKTFSAPGAGVTEADDRQVTTVFTVQPSFHHRHSTNQVS